jgi:hypothetical protein
MIWSELVAERRRLLDQWDAVDSPRKLLRIQERIAHQIRTAEAKLKAGQEDEDELRSHISQLRLYADGLAWQVLHPHVIRQLAKNPGKPPSLLGQGEAFENVLRSARDLFRQRRLPIVIADITNVIKIGDIIVVTHPEVPQIVECKTNLPHPKHWMEGRLGRQLSRLLGTAKYLAGQPVKVHGDNHVRVVVESQHKPERDWEAVRVCVDAALKHVEGSVQLSEHEFLWACREAQLSTVVERVGATARTLSQPVFFGTSQGLLNMSDGLFPPPITWPLAPETRFALMERDVTLIHLVSASAFEGDYGECRVAVGDRRPSPVSVFIGEEELRFGLRFIYDVLYGFETAESCVRGLLTFAREVRDLQSQAGGVPPDVQTSAKKPRIIYAESMEDARRARLTQSEDEIVFMPEELARRLASSMGGGDEPGNG